MEIGSIFRYKKISNQPNSVELLGRTTKIFASHLSKNPVPLSELPDMIRLAYGLLQATTSSEAVEEKLTPAVSIRRSITPDYIVCLEDGRKLKMLKRHLKTAFGLTPEDYRRKWSLPPDYPVVAPNYARQRSGLAKKIGLGKRACKR